MSQKFKILLAPFALLMLGLFMAHHPMIFSGFEQVQRDLGDTRLVILFLEHTYQWITGHHAFADPGYFYPASMVTYYGDLMLGFAPPYWIARGLGLEPDSSYQSWLIVFSILNFAAAFALFRKGFKLTPFWAAWGSFLVSFSSNHVNQVGHPQMWPLVYPLVFYLSILKLQDAANNHRGSFLWLLTAGTAFVMQFFSAYYWAWFLVFFCFLLLCIECSSKSGRHRLRSLWTFNRRHLFVVVPVMLLVLAPALYGYLTIASQVGLRRFTDVASYLLSMEEWLYYGPDHWLHGWRAGLPEFQNLFGEIELRVGLGEITIVAGLTGLWLARRDALMRRLIILTGILFFVLTIWHYGFKPWAAIYHAFPGARAIRSVGRFSQFMMIPLAVGCAALWMKLKAGSKIRWLMGLAMAIMVLEQGVTTPSYSKAMARDREQSLASKIPASCRSFVHITIGPDTMSMEQVDLYQIDAMGAARILKIPTVNGYSGNQPPGYPLKVAVAFSESKHTALIDETRRWLSSIGQNPDDVCIIP